MIAVHRVLMGDIKRKRQR